MSTRALEHEIFEVPAAEQEAPVIGGRPPWDADEFAAEQIRRLVRQVFLPGWPRPARQVVFSPVDPDTYVAELCMQVGHALSGQVTGNVGVVEANLRHPELEGVFGTDGREPASGQERFGSLRNASRQISRNLWLVPAGAFLGENENGLSAAWLRGRLGELRLDFDYTLLHGPAAGQYSEAALLGHMCDGVVLVLQANSTRRVAAQKVKEALQSANARLLGAVLSERTFPIPEGIYRKL